MTIIVSTPANRPQIETRVTGQSNAIGNAAQSGIIPSGRFVFFAAFDGTNNNRNGTRDVNGNLSLSSLPNDTNVSQLQLQVVQAQQTNSNVRSIYYEGPGGEPSNGNGLLTAAFPTNYIRSTVERAYRDFYFSAKDWLEQNPGAEITVAMTAFSRGGATAAEFSQVLYERGLRNPDTGEILIPPGKIGVSAAVIYEPVETYVDGNRAFAPNVQNILVVRAENEYRDAFKATDYEGQPGVTTVWMAGNHSDIGGGYDNGIGALVLAQSTQFLRDSGVPIADVSSARVYNPDQLNVHSEGYRQVTLPSGEIVTQPGIFTSYGSYEQGTQRRTDPNITVNAGQTTQLADDSTERVFVTAGGRQITQNTTAAQLSASVCAMRKIKASSAT